MPCRFAFFSKPAVRHLLYLAGLQSMLFLMVRQLVPTTEELSLYVLALSLSTTFVGLSQLASLSAGFALTSAIHIVLYQRVSGLGFDLHQLIQNPYEATLSVILTLGSLKTIFVIMEFAFSTIVFAWGFEACSRRLAKRTIVFVWPSIVALAVTILVGARLGFFYASASAVSGIDVRFEGNPDDLPQDNQSLFMLQMESLNGQAVQDGGLDLIGTKKLVEMGGSTIPYFWGLHYGTNHGFSSILCGTSGAFSHHLVHPADGFPCLPERFKRAGFETVYYYSYRASDFYRMEENVSALGFQKFIYGDQLMDKDDPFYRWGYEDCRFFDRAFADMKKTGLDKRKKIFVYFSVHMNHTPFENHLSIDHPFKDPTSFKEKYLNSAYEQDYCMGKFLDHVRALNRDDINVVMSGDHGFPVEPKLELYDHYMTRFQFIPSSKNKAKFPSKVVEDVSPAQDQILSTVLELFGAPRRSSSFLWSLLGEAKPSDYRRCAIVADRADNLVFAINGEEAVKKYTLLNTFEKLSYQSRKLKDTLPLQRISDWKSVEVPGDCLRRLGIPKFN